jgi:hypothetical protein
LALLTGPFSPLLRGEQTASTLENDLSKLEAKLDEILAGLDPDMLEAVNAAESAAAEDPEPGKNEDGKK